MIEEALTFDDVLLQPSETSIGPGDADVRTKITNKIHLNIPLISSAMDTVTDGRLAIQFLNAEELVLYIKIILLKSKRQK